MRGVKPTMPMNAFPPGGPPGTPPPGGGGGWGPPGGGGPPPYGGPPSYGGGQPPSYGGQPPSYGGGFPPPQAPPKKSKTGLYVGIGCGCMLLLACIAGGGIFWAVKSLGPGEEVSSVDATVGTPFTLTYNQTGSQKYAAWLEVDVSHTAGYQLTGTITLEENGVAFGQYTLNEDGSGAAVSERSDSTRINWVHTNSSTEGTTNLFPIPARAAGSSITVRGTVNASPGTTGRIRIFVAKRD